MKNEWIAKALLVVAVTVLYSLAEVYFFKNELTVWKIAGCISAMWVVLIFGRLISKQKKDSGPEKGK